MQTDCVCIKQCSIGELKTYEYGGSGKYVGMSLFPTVSAYAARHAPPHVSNAGSVQKTQ